MANAHIYDEQVREGKMKTEDNFYRTFIETCACVYKSDTTSTEVRIIYMELKYAGGITPRRFHYPSRWDKVKQDEGVKYLPNNLCDSFKVDRDKRSIPPERREDTSGISPFSSTAKQVLTAAINNEAQLKGRPPAKSVAKRWKWCRVVG